VLVKETYKNQGTRLWGEDAKASDLLKKS